MSKVQLNFSVPKTMADRVRADARRNNKSLDSVGSAIIGDFFRAYAVTERARFYEHTPRKVAGRKIRIPIRTV